MGKNEKAKFFDVFFVGLAVVFLICVFFILHAFFGRTINDFTLEILAATLGSTIIMASMVIMLRMQVKQEKEREFSTALFGRKLDLYENLLKTIFEADDDDFLSTEELQTIENLVGVACLVAGEDLVDVFTQFVFQLKGYGVMYSRSMTDIQKEHFIGNVEKGLPVDYASSWLAQSKYDHNKTPKEDPDFYFMSLDEVVQSMRTDLDVVEGVIMNNIETFVSIGYDEFHMIKDPNKV